LACRQDEATECSSASTAALIFVLRPPRERPVAPSSLLPFRHRRHVDVPAQTVESVISIRDQDLRQLSEKPLAEALFAHHRRRQNQCCVYHKIAIGDFFWPS
jgi:hypothetical protein